MIDLKGPLLAIDSSTSTASVAVGDRTGLIAEISLDLPVGGRSTRGRQPRPGHSSSLLPMIDRALAAASLGAEDLGGVVVGAGPGSFTGVRIAAATAKGIVHARGIPLFAFSSLLAIGTQAWAADGTVVPMIDARGRDVFAAFYSFARGVSVLEAPEATTVDDVLRGIAERLPVVCLGDGADKHRAELHAAGAVVAAPHHHTARAAGLLWLAYDQPEMGAVEDPFAWEPEYHRASGAERIAASRAREGRSP
jgi:tRNA threonylcarbamoyladenosine biosynthesis protein TsaB